MILNTHGWVECGNNWFKHTPNKRTKLRGEFKNASVLNKLKRREDVVKLANLVEEILMQSVYAEFERMRDPLADCAMDVRRSLMHSFTCIQKKAYDK